MEDFSSSIDLSFLMSARTYLARALGSASHLHINIWYRYRLAPISYHTYRGSRWLVSHFLSSSGDSINIFKVNKTFFQHKSFNLQTIVIKIQ